MSGYQSTRPWVSNWCTTIENYTGGITVVCLDTIIPSRVPYLIAGSTEVNMDEVDLIFISTLAQINSIATQVTDAYNTGKITANNVTTYFLNKTFIITSSAPGFGEYYALSFDATSDTNTYQLGQKIVVGVDKYHFDKNGKVFTQNDTIPEISRLPMYFKWSHYSPIDQRVDPAPTNIIDMIVITNSYYTDITNWKNNNGTKFTIPAAPTTEELRIQFDNLNQYKMVSDSIVWNSGEFKILFGPQAEAELQATFKVVKAPSSSISDNEVKTQVIQAIDIYFDIRNWDFGEKFFYTELAAFIHQQLSRTISSVVIVPTNANSQFGNLFEIVASPNQIFMSTATVNNVAIVANLTDQNLRV